MEADALAKEATNLDMANIRIPHTDKKNKINTYIKKKWQEIWDQQTNNKLKEIQPIVGLENIKPLTERKQDTKYNRIRIGHTRLTHKHLLNAETTPKCDICGCTITIKHILMECQKFQHIRKKYFNVPDIKTLFGETSPYKILDFLRRINLLELL